MRINVQNWARPSEIDSAGSNSSFWGEYGIWPTGVHQGSLGDCWFLASASALAEHGARVEKVFANRDRDDDGFYVFEFFLLGEPKYLVIDDRLPVMEAGAGETFLSTGTQYKTFMSGPSDYGAWWLPILEKAYAKFIKTYADLNAGNEWESLRGMTGMPVRNF